MDTSFWIILNVLLLCLSLTTFIQSRPVKEEAQETGADKRMWKPPIFPYWGPFGWHSSAILCPFMYGPYSKYTARGCAGPAPPFTTPQPPPSTTATTTIAPTSRMPPSQMGHYYGQDNDEEQDDDTEYEDEEQYDEAECEQDQENVYRRFI